MGPDINTGKKDNAFRTITTINKNKPNVPESGRNIVIHYSGKAM
jgi:hypothetical protein